MEVWYDVEWFDSGVGWRNGKTGLTREQADGWVEIWKSQGIQTQIIEVTQTRKVLP